MQLFLTVLLLTFVKINVILCLNYFFKTYFGEALGGFFGFKNPVPQIFWLLADVITSVSDLLDGYWL